MASALQARPGGGKGRAGEQSKRRKGDDLSIEDWREQKYDEVFRRTCLHLEARRRSDPAFTVEHVEGLLRTAYVDQGNDWVGRGALHEIVQSATIAAYEHLLTEWGKEPLGDSRGP